MPPSVPIPLDPIAAYDGKAADYASYRLPYAPGTVDAIVAASSLDQSWIVADIGSGTGHLTRLLVGSARRVYAVEPNADMRREAQRLLHGQVSVQHVPGTAEQSALPSGIIDLVTVGQALHWFDRALARRELARILRPGGWLAIVWNRFSGEDDPDLEGLFLSKGSRRLSFPMTVRETWEQFLGGTRSAAAAPPLSAPPYRQWEQAQRELFDRRAVDGLLAVTYSTEIAVGRLERSRA